MNKALKVLFQILCIFGLMMFIIFSSFIFANFSKFLGVPTNFLGGFLWGTVIGNIILQNFKKLSTQK